jgi:hypothetical protein
MKAISIGAGVEAETPITLTGVSGLPAPEEKAGPIRIACANIRET